MKNKINVEKCKGMQNDIKIDKNKMYVYLSLKYRFLMRSNYFILSCFFACQARMGK